MSDQGGARPGGGGLARRDVLACGAFAAVFPGAHAWATDDEVTDAIAEDFGAFEAGDGHVTIDLPDYSDSGKSVPLSVAVECTMRDRDYPEVIAVYASRNPRPRIAKAYFTPHCSEAAFSTRIRVDSYQDITVVVRMADGRHFRAVRKVDVTYGACEDKLASDQFPPGWAPPTRVAAPATAQPGEAVDIRTIIGHPMETGFRYNAQGLTVPVRIAEWFRCYLNGDLAFAVDLEPAISANPYFAFKLTIEKTSDLRFVWVDTTAEVYSDAARIVVS